MSQLGLRDHHQVFKILLFRAYSVIWHAVSHLDMLHHTAVVELGRIRARFPQAPRRRRARASRRGRVPGPGRWSLFARFPANEPGAAVKRMAGRQRRARDSRGPALTVTSQA